MKYIRTEDGVYELKVNERLKAQKTSNYFYIYHKQYGCNLLYDKQDLKKCRKADSIKKLCDELVLKDLDTEMCFVMSAVHIQDIRDNWKNLMDNDYLKNHTIYGAIWTDKGLIYVAKMNDKGELELL